MQTGRQCVPAAPHHRAVRPGKGGREGGRQAGRQKKRGRQAGREAGREAGRDAGSQTRARTSEYFFDLRLRSVDGLVRSDHFNINMHIHTYIHS